MVMLNKTRTKRKKLESRLFGQIVLQNISEYVDLLYYGAISKNKVFLIIFHVQKLKLKKSNSFKLLANVHVPYSKVHSKHLVDKSLPTTISLF